MQLLPKIAVATRTTHLPVRVPSLQENNAIATLDLASGQITAIHGLGFKDHSLNANAMDASDK